MLDVFLRTCDNAVVHPERGKRFIDVDKTTLIKKCFLSLIRSMLIARELSESKLWIIDDHSDQKLLDFFNLVCISNNIDLEIISLDQKGFNYSATKQFEYCKNYGREWVYCVEDDYLHYPRSLLLMLHMGQELKDKFKTNVALKSYDDPFSYSDNNSASKKPCRIILGNDRYWRTSSDSHNTIFTNVEVFRNYWEIFASLSKFYKILSVNEESTINKLWSDGVESHGPVPLFSPIPALAIHISQDNEPFYMDYMTLWDNIKIDDT